MSKLRKLIDPKSQKEEYTLVINDVPFWKWTHKEYDIWRQETLHLMEYLERVKGKLAWLCSLKGIDLRAIH